MQYWPPYTDYPQKYGKLTLELAWEELLDDYIMRQIQITLTEVRNN